MWRGKWCMRSSREQAAPQLFRGNKFTYHSEPMAWRVENRRLAVIDERAESYLTEELKRILRDNYFPRYPTKRAVLLPALHLVQHTYNWIPHEAMVEIAELLEITPAEVL